jgi:hypothetical protein
MLLAAAVAPDRALHELQVMRTATVDAAWLREAERWTDHLIAAYRRIPPGEVLPHVRDHLDRLDARLPDPMSDAARSRLGSLVADTAALAGWCAMADRRWAEARAKLALARDAARDAGDELRHAQALVLTSALHSNIPRGGHRPSAPALRLLTEAAVRLRTLDAPPLTRAWAAARLAEERAAATDDTGSAKALATAGRAVAEGPDPRDSRGFFSLAGFLGYWRDPNALRGFEGIALRLCGDPRTAVTVLAETLRDTTDVVQEAALRTEIALALAASGEPDGACAHATVALDIADGAGFALRRERVRGLADRLPPGPHAAELHERLALA